MNILINTQIFGCVMKCVESAVRQCSDKYGFDADEALRDLDVSFAESRSKTSEGKLRVTKISKPAFPMPFSGEFSEDLCHGLQLNNGLYTQCCSKSKGQSVFCATHKKQADSSAAGIPTHGTIQQRVESGFDFVDPSGKKPTPYTKIMKKHNLSQEQVIEEAERLNIIIDPRHFEEIEETKKGRPKVEKAAKEPKQKSKGRPKKEKKVVETAQEDMFASIVAEIDSSDEAEDFEPRPRSGTLPSLEMNQEGMAQAEEESKKYEAEVAADEAKKAAIAKKEAKKAAAAEKEAKKLAAEEAKKAAAAEKEAKKVAAEEAKKAKEAKAEEAKKAKAAAEEAKAEEAKKLSEKSAKPAPAKTESGPFDDDEDDEEEEIACPFVYEGIKFYKTEKSGIVYTKNQDCVGKWNEEMDIITYWIEDDEDDGTIAIKFNSKKYFRSPAGFVYDSNKGDELVGTWDIQKRTIKFFENAESSSESEEEEEEEEYA
jgi:hypothetical protein